MKTVEPAHQDVTIAPAKDRTDVSDLYLLNQQLVEQNQEERDKHPELRIANDPLAVRREFRWNDVYTIAISFALVSVGPFISAPLMSLGDGNGFSVLTAVCFIFLIGIGSAALLRAIFRMVSSVCVYADINSTLANIAHATIVLLSFIAQYIIFGVRQYLVAAIAFLITAILHVVILRSLYLITHSKKL